MDLVYHVVSPGFRRYQVILVGDRVSCRETRCVCVCVCVTCGVEGQCTAAAAIHSRHRRTLQARLTLPDLQTHNTDSIISSPTSSHAALTSTSHVPSTPYYCIRTIVSRHLHQRSLKISVKTLKAPLAPLQNFSFVAPSPEKKKHSLKAKTYMYTYKTYTIRHNNFPAYLWRRCCSKTIRFLANRPP